MPKVSLNSVSLIGNLTEDPDVRMTRNNKPITSFSIAINESYRTKSGDWAENTTFVRVRVFRDYGKLSKGDLVLVSGKLYNNNWERDGRRHSRLEVSAFKVNKIMSPGERGESRRAREPERDRAPEPERRSSGHDYDDDDIPF